MRLRNWLLTGTSLGLLAFAPLGVSFAQDAKDPALVSAFEAYKSDQSDANKDALTQACIAAGFSSLDDCIAALTGAQVVQPEPAAPPAEEAPAPAAEEPAPPAEEAPAPAPAEPAPVSSEEAPAPAPQEEAPAPSEEAPAPAPEEQAAPPSSEEQAAPPPADEQAAPPASSEEAPAPAPDNGGDVLAQLTAAVDLYNEGVADLTAGDANGQAKIDQANTQITAICTTAGFADNASCVAQFGLALNPLPETAAPPATEPSSEAPVSSDESPAADEAVTPEAVEVLPSDIAPEEAAPILDSAKDQQNAQNAPPDANASSSEEPAPAAPAEPAAPPPADDKQAQADIQPPPPEQQSTQTEQGEKIDVGSITLEPQPPEDNPDVKVVDHAPSHDNGAVIFQIGINIFINNPEQDRDRYYDRDRDQIYYEQLSRGRVRETIVRPDGTRIVTVRNRNGDILQRSKILPNGREIVLAYYDDENDNGFLIDFRDPGDELPPLVLNIPARDYILDADDADEDQVEVFLDQPPVEQVRRIYSIDEVKRSARLRDSVRRLEVGGLTFDTGKATISRDQVASLATVGKAMQKLLDKDPAEVFLIEGHTDAVGSDVSNLALSDERAATVAKILTQFYDIPPENLVSQGYGERYLKVQTEGAEKLNRRVTIKRITPLISYSAGN